MALDTVAQLRKRHPDYTGPLGAAWWTLARDAYQATGGFRATVQTAQTGTYGDRDGDTDDGTPTEGSYLVRYPRETAGQFSRRQAVSTYTNHVAPILDEYAGHLWRRAPQRSTSDPEVERWWASVDGRGTGIDAWLEGITRKLQLIGWIPVLVDRPEGELTASEALTYTRALEPEELVDWQRAGDGSFDWARLCTVTVDRDPFTGATVERETYTTWTRTDWQTVVLVNGEQGWAVESQSPRTPHRLGRVPVAILYWQAPVDPSRLYGMAQADGLVSCALEHFNVSSELREHERGQVFCVLCVQSDNPNVWDGIKLGTHDGLRYGTDATAPSYLAPPDSVGLYLSDRLKRVEDRIWELAHLERPSGQPQGESGISRQWKFGQTRSILVGATKRLVAGERDLLDLVLRWQYPGQLERVAEAQAGTTIAYAEDFDVDDLATVLESRLAVLQRPEALVPETARAARLAIGKALNSAATPEEDTALREQVQARYTAETLALQGAGQTTSQETALNGAQVASLVDVVKAAALGEIPRESAAEIITLAYPVDAAKAGAILGPIGQGFVPTAAPTSKTSPRTPEASTDDGATADAEEEDDAGQTDSAETEGTEAP